MAAHLDGYEPLNLHHRGDVCYALKKHAPGGNRHSKGRSSREVKDEVLNSARLQRTMQEVAVETGREVKAVEKEVQCLLEEIGHKMVLPAVRTVVLFLRMALRRLLRGIYVNREGVERLRGLVEQWPVVLLPSHRSYLDFLLVSLLMYDHGIQLPCIAAGQDFMNMKTVSSFLRRSGAFFLRRTFSSDQLYKAVFAGYVQALLSSGDAPLEFFIEGTRSRTAKSLHPKLGLMSMVVEPYLAGWLPDIMMVPISISYERTLEEQLFARELLGVPKPKESTKGLLKVTSILSEDYGSILITIGNPLSLHDVCLSHGVSRVPRSVFPKDATLVLPKERQLILELGHMILEHTEQGMRVFPSAMVAALVLQSPEGVARSDLVERMEWLRKEITQHGGQVHWEGDADSAVASGLRMLYTSLEVTEDNIVRAQGGRLLSELFHSPRRQCRIEEVVTMELSRTDLDLITEISFIHLLLAHYRNQLLHLFVPEAMLALCLHRDTPTDIASALRRFEALHCALAREFVLPLKSPKELFSEALQCLLDRGVLQCHEQGWAVLNGHLEETFVFLRNLILPFAVGIWVVCQHLISIAGGVQSLNATVKGSQRLAAKCIQTGLLSHYEILSLEMVKNALASLTLAEFIRQPSSEVEGRDRLVMVAEQDKLVQLATELGTAIFTDQEHPWIGTPTAKL